MKTLRARLAVLQMAILLAVTTGGGVASACSPVDPFALTDIVVVGEITAVRQTAWRVLFWGSNRWEAEVVTRRRLQGSSPDRFTYYASDFSIPGCTAPPDRRPSVGEVLVFPVQKVDALYIDAEGYAHETPGWNGRYAALGAMTEHRWASLNRPFR